VVLCNEDSGEAASRDKGCPAMRNIRVALWEYNERIYRDGNEKIDQVFKMVPDKIPKLELNGRVNRGLFDILGKGFRFMAGV